MEEEEEEEEEEEAGGSKISGHSYYRCLTRGGRGGRGGRWGGQGHPIDHPDLTKKTKKNA